MRFTAVKAYLLYSLWVIDCRLNTLSENVTHAVIGERIEKDLEMLKTAAFRFVSLYNLKSKPDLWKIFFKLFDNICGKNIHDLTYTGIITSKEMIVEQRVRLETWNDSSIFESYNLHNDFRPHVVTPVWMAECFRQGFTVNEDPYRLPEFPPLDPQSPQVKG